MLDEKELSYYRSLSPGERLALGLELSAWAWRWLDVPDRETGDRKWRAWMLEHDRSNEALVAALREQMRREQMQQGESERPSGTLTPDDIGEVQ